MPFLKPLHQLQVDELSFLSPVLFEKEKQQVFTVNVPTFRTKSNKLFILF